MVQSTTDDSILAARVGKASVGENLAEAVAVGRLIAHGDGTWELPQGRGRVSSWVFCGPRIAAPCEKLMGFLFQGAYGEAAVPWGCRNCYKVQVKPRTLRQLHAVLRIARPLGLTFKCGTTLTVPHMAGPYAALFYTDTLARAKEVFHQVRRAVDDHEALGNEVPMGIKRGCTEYELACGPSDCFDFPPERAELEAQLLARLRPLRKADTRKAELWTLLRWNHVAFRIGDETYHDLTGGRRLYPEPVLYDPGAPP